MMKISVDDIKVSERLRQLDNSKVDDLVTSIKEIGLLQPVVVDNNNNLLAGWHRLEACKHLGFAEIECKQISVPEQKKQLIEIDENLVHNDLTVIQRAEHITLKEKILKDLGVRATANDNRYTRHDILSPLLTNKELADEIGVSSRQYQRLKQIGKIHPTARQILHQTEVGNNLKALLQIQQLNDDDLQIEIASKIKGGYSGSISVLIGNLIREEHDDFYPTDPVITQMLLDREELGRTIWEPACGAGDMSKVLLNYGYDVCSTDLVDRGYGTSGIDFLNDKQFSKLSYDCIVTNPPFRLGLEFVLKAKEIARKKICILNSTTFLNGIERYEKLWMDREFPLKKMYQFAGRVSFRKEDYTLPTGNWMSFAWYVFEREYIGSPMIEWILPEPNKIE